MREISNCLLIGTLGQSANDTGIVRPTSQYAPTDLTIGIREVYYYETGKIAIVIHGITTSGVYKEWYRYYNGSTWTDWFRGAFQETSTLKKTRATYYLKDFTWTSAGTKWWGTLTVPKHFIATLSDFSNVPSGYTFEFFDIDETKIQVFGSTNSFNDAARIIVNLYSY